MKKSRKLWVVCAKKEGMNMKWQDMGTHIQKEWVSEENRGFQFSMWVGWREEGRRRRRRANKSLETITIFLCTIHCLPYTPRYVVHCVFYSIAPFIFITYAQAKDEHWIFVLLRLHTKNSKLPTTTVISHTAHKNKIK